MGVKGSLWEEEINLDQHREGFLKGMIEIGI